MQKTKQRNFHNPDLKLVRDDQCLYPAEPGKNPLAEMLGKIDVSRILWSVTLIFYACIGAGAAFVSFLIEKEAFFRITQEPHFSLWIVLIFEAAKIGTIIVYGLLFRTRTDIPSDTVRLVRVFQFFLIALSFVCSLAMVALNLDRPNLEAVRAGDKKQAEADYMRDYDVIETRHDAEIKGLKSRFGSKYDEAHRQLKAYYEPKIDHARNELRQEMDNVVSGTFKGERYREFERQKNLLEVEYHEKLGALSAQRAGAGENLEAAIGAKEEERRMAVENLSERKKAALDKIETGSYIHDDRVNNRMINAVLMTLNQGVFGLIGLEIRQVNFVCGFSILIAILIELCIYITFYSAVLNFSSDLDLVFAADRSNHEVKKNS
ncbi:hypothetical protein QUF80_10310 [Desulfococcaceae bacterium HSG8]|nr:hypothetical protein [Desulfococcaceae bacterium HSG8]